MSNVSAMLDTPMTGKAALPAAEAVRPLVALSAVSVRRGGRTVLSDVDFAIGPGEIVTVIGPNGGGKTTFLKVVLGLVPPATGRIERRPGLRFGYAPQKLSIDPTIPLSVRRLMTLTARHDETAVLAALEETGVGHLAAADA